MPLREGFQRGAARTRASLDDSRIGVSEFAEEELVSRMLVADPSLFAVLRAETLAAHEARCERVARNVMHRIADLPQPIVSSERRT